MTRTSSCISIPPIPAKADRAEALLGAGGHISVQVLNEFAAVATRKLGMSWPEVGETLSIVRSVCLVEPLTVDTHDRARLIAERYGFRIYDAMIIAAALLAGCTVLYLFGGSAIGAENRRAANGSQPLSVAAMYVQEG